MNMNVDTGVARARAEKVMDAAARSGAALPLHQEWRPKVDTSDPKSRWIVEGTKVDPREFQDAVPEDLGAEAPQFSRASRRA